jgi:VanZ family protein
MKFVKLWLPVFLWAGFIFFLSSIPSLKTNLPQDFILRKIAHFTEYYILTFFLYRAFGGSFRLSFWYSAVWVVALAFLYALSDEFHQIFVYDRYCSAVDVLIDSAGIISFYIILKIVMLTKKIKNHD